MLLVEVNFVFLFIETDENFNILLCKLDFATQKNTNLNSFVLV